MSTLNDSVLEDAVFPTVENTGVGGMKQESRVLDFDRLNFSLDMNPRTLDAYGLEKIGWLGRSLVTYGQQEPMLVSQRADGTNHMLRGFLRGAAINHVRKTGIPAVKGDEKNQPAIPADPKFMEKVNVLLVKGLTRQQEIDLVMDHGTKTGLNEVERYTSAKIMMQAGFSRALIAAKLRITVGNFNNGIGRIFALPSYVEAMYLDPKAPVQITQDALKILYPAMVADQKITGAEAKVGGENFNLAWEKFLKDGGNAKRVKGMSRDDLTDIINVTENRDIRALLQAVRDNDPQGVASAIIRIELDIKLTTTIGTGVVRVEEGIPTTVGDFEHVV